MKFLLFSTKVYSDADAIYNEYAWLLMCDYVKREGDKLYIEGDEKQIMTALSDMANNFKRPVILDFSDSVFHCPTIEIYDYWRE